MKKERLRKKLLREGLKVPYKLIRDRRLSTAARSILAAIDQYVEEDEQDKGSSLGNKSLMLLTGLAESTVKNTMHDLREKGILNRKYYEKPVSKRFLKINWENLRRGR